MNIGKQSSKPMKSLSEFLNKESFMVDMATIKLISKSFGSYLSDCKVHGALTDEFCAIAGRDDYPHISAMPFESPVIIKSSDLQQLIESAKAHDRATIRVQAKDSGLYYFCFDTVGECNYADYMAYYKVFISAFIYSQFGQVQAIEVLR